MLCSVPRLHLRTNIMSRSANWESFNTSARAKGTMKLQTLRASNVQDLIGMINKLGDIGTHEEARWRVKMRRRIGSCAIAKAIGNVFCGWRRHSAAASATRM